MDSFPTFCHPCFVLDLNDRLSSWLVTLVGEGSFIVLDVEVEGGLLRLSSFGFGVSVICCFFFVCVLCPTRRGKKMKGGGWWLE